MGAHCCNHHHDDSDINSPRWRRALWIALVLNAGMFLIEIIAGIAAGSSALEADALDFFADTATYAVSLFVAGMSLSWRNRVALYKGISMTLLGMWILSGTIWHLLLGIVPQSHVMGVVGALAMMTNVGVAVILYKFREGDANMHSVWICTRNDAIGNVAVLLAALGVFGTGTGYPDYIVAMIMATLSIIAGLQVTHRVHKERVLLC